MMAPYRNFCFPQHVDFTQNAASQKSSMITIITVLICFIVTTSGMSLPTSVIHAKVGGIVFLRCSFKQGFQPPFIELCYLKEENNDHIMWAYDAEKNQIEKCDPDFCNRTEINVSSSNRSICIKIKTVKPSDSGMYRLTVLNGRISEVILELQVSDTAEQDEKEDVKSHCRIYVLVFSAVLTAALVALLAIMICRKRDVDKGGTHQYENKSIKLTQPP